MDGQAHTHTHAQAREQADRRTRGGTVSETGTQSGRQGGRQAGRGRLPDRHAPMVAGQAVGVGRRHGDSECLWQRGRER